MLIAPVTVKFNTDVLLQRRAAGTRLTRKRRTPRAAPLRLDFTVKRILLAVLS